MLILISCAKIMREDESNLSEIVEPFCRDFAEPRFQSDANSIANYMRDYSADELSLRLKVNDDIAAQTHERYLHFGSVEKSLAPAIFSYNGIVFKSIDPARFSIDDMEYAQHHLLITSFLYGLLRPLDMVEAYRLEGKFRIEALNTKDLFAYWKSRLTDLLIEDVKAAGGVMCNLASREMEGLFDWKRVCREVRVVTPEFYVDRGGKRKTIVVYTKMARGFMTQYILRSRVDSVEDLFKFDVDGYRFEECDGQRLIFIKK